MNTKMDNEELAALEVLKQTGALTIEGSPTTAAVCFTIAPASLNGKWSINKSPAAHTVQRGMNVNLP